MASVSALVRGMGDEFHELNQPIWLDFNGGIQIMRA